MTTQNTYKLAKIDLGQQHKQKRGRIPSKMVCAVSAHFRVFGSMAACTFHSLPPFEKERAGTVVVSPGRDTAS